MVNVPKKKTLTNVNILAEIENKKPKLCALFKMNISERSEVENKKCTGLDTYNPAKDISPLFLNIIQTHQVAPNGVVLLSMRMHQFKLIILKSNRLVNPQINIGFG